MYKKVKPYMGRYTKYTYGSFAVMFVSLIASAVPYYVLYTMIKPLLDGKSLSAGEFAAKIAIIFACELVYTYLYVFGLMLSHISAFNTQIGRAHV